MRTRDYIDAVSDILRKKGDVENTLATLRQMLQSRGLMKLYPAILRGVLQKQERTVSHEETQVIFARSEDTEKFTDEIIAHLATRNLPHIYTYSIDPTIVGGYIIKTKNERINKSYKQILLHTYRTIIK